MRWWRKLKAWFRKEPWGIWLLLYHPQGASDPVILGDFEGTPEEAQDAAQCASVNWMWKSGAFAGGQAALGEYGILPVKRYGGQLVPDLSRPPNGMVH